MDRFYYSCCVPAMLSCLFIAALWSSAGKGLTSWLSYLMFSCAFVNILCGALGQVWYLIDSIPDLCLLLLSMKIYLLEKVIFTEATRLILMSTEI